jgi:HEPN domain-containing protein
MCYHCSQCAEKIIEAVLLESDIAPKQTHDLIWLAEMLPDSDSKEKLYSRCEVLKPYATMTRYPYTKDGVFRASEEDAADAYDSLLEILRILGDV